MSKEFRPEIIGFGKARGSRVVTNADVAEMLGLPPKVMERMAKSIGLIERGWCEDGESTSTMAAEAALKAIEMANIPRENIKAINVATGLPDYLGVPTGAILQEMLGVSTNVATRDLSAACPGFMHALQLTYADLSSEYGLGGPQLTVASEVVSRAISPLRRQTFLLFGDGAGAVVLDNVEVDDTLPKAKFVFGADGRFLKDLYVPAGGSIMAITQEAIDQGLNCIDMNGQVVFEQAVARMCELAEKVLSETGAKLSDINLLIPHQANQQIIQAVAQKLDFPINRVFVNIGKYGNTSAASIPIGLTEAYEEGRLSRGDLVLSTTFGAGLNFGAALLPMNGLPERRASDGSK